ncbi:hypothetical protein BDQ12DRAFT_766453 [Crucibulum laeve]|uniref:T6SS Phospholipase effector Tle1-like catalytic domain-containing protein n=1 Tax=Crucibulum laeve TaxID=68775 RepID=A0A5C3LNR1_9AGAR|nr:hypothetical protein BDQ12DRAFT_766453 [Crucibulum laeve]
MSEFTAVGDPSHFQSASRVSFAGSDTATLSGPTPQGSKFTSSDVHLATSPLSPAAVPLPNTYIPATHENRTLVLCFDGTGDQFDSDNSNIVELFSMLKKDDPTKQMVYYQAGIGTYTTPQIATPMVAKMSKTSLYTLQTLDEMIAWNLDAHIMGGYEFLMEHYQTGDRICIFGFSRGAYTARCLAGMIHKVGLLPTGNRQQVPFAYKMYTRPDDEGWKQSNAFRKAFSIVVDIEFLGVWDTVNSVGLFPRRLPFTTSNTIVRTFRHAVSLDERRAKFKANLWNRPNKKEVKLAVNTALGGTSPSPTDGSTPTTPTATESPATSTVSKGEGSSTLKKGPKPVKKPASKLRALERLYSHDRATPTDIDEVWFSGCHCDVGGGSVANETKPNLARIPLRWMIRECFKTDTGIMFSANGLQSVGLDPVALLENPSQRPPALPVGSCRIQAIPKKPLDAEVQAANNLAETSLTEEEFELRDAMSPVYDQLSLRWVWWILELIPLYHKFQRSDNTWKVWWGWNLGRGRKIPRQEKNGVRVHRSVKMRMEAGYADGKKYVPKANLDVSRVTWVD